MPAGRVGMDRVADVDRHYSSDSNTESSSATLSVTQRNVLARTRECSVAAKSGCSTFMNGCQWCDIDQGRTLENHVGAESMLMQARARTRKEMV